MQILEPHGNIYITSERKLEPEFESHRININPLDIHHVMAFARLYIGFLVMSWPFILMRPLFGLMNPTIM